jgi:hypothetical protein
MYSLTTIDLRRRAQTAAELTAKATGNNHNAFFMDGSL